MIGQRAAQAAGAPEPLVYSVEQAAHLLGIGRTFMFRLLATGEIESFKIGKRRKVAREALAGYINRLRREQSTAGDDGSLNRVVAQPILDMQGFAFPSSGTSEAAQADELAQPTDNPAAMAADEAPVSVTAGVGDE